MSLVINDYEAYMLVKEHLLNQKEAAKDTNDDCQYRGFKESTLQKAKDQAVMEMINEGELDEREEEMRMLQILEGQYPDAKCAVGCLISDDFYKQDFEGRTIERSCHVWDAVKLSNPLWKMTDASHEMLKELQAIHDNNNPDDWEYRLLKLNASFDKYGDYEKEKENE
jgi:hypothetical protein